MKDTVRIFKPDDFMVLDQIDVVDAQTPQRFVELFAASFFDRPSILSSQTNGRDSRRELPCPWRSLSPSL